MERDDSSGNRWKHTKKPFFSPSFTNLLIMIPRTIHQIWMQGQEVLPAKYQAFQQTWKQEKDFAYEFWDQKGLKILLISSNNPEWQRITIYALH